jgi:hypothetical protein
MTLINSLIEGFVIESSPSGFLIIHRHPEQSKAKNFVWRN